MKHSYVKDPLEVFQVLHSLEAKTLTEANNSLAQICGIQNFFSNEFHLSYQLAKVKHFTSLIQNDIRRDFGDFQTNQELSDKICSRIGKGESIPTAVFEPTFGRGGFLLSALKFFNDLENIYGVEIHEPYVWETKLKILDFYIRYPSIKKPKIYLFNENIFDFDYSIVRKKLDRNLFILGNPPWVTNAELSSVQSSNLPLKKNIFNIRGIEAITGKGNFDIGEYITSQLLENFSKAKGEMHLLLKNSVIKNIVKNQKSKCFSIGNLSSDGIDSRKEFNASVKASLFSCGLNSIPEEVCRSTKINSSKREKRLGSSPVVFFGWVGDKFVSNTEAYKKSSEFDGKSKLNWRQGVKHDCSDLMELEINNMNYRNNLGEVFELEPDLVYDLVKSSDLRNHPVVECRKKIILTQKYVGQDTSYIQSSYPKTHMYLEANRKRFEKRKSAIYKNRPPFSIFGIGDYSFKCYKVAISGFYNSTDFSLVASQGGKPIMLDDTCYYLGFDEIHYAEITLELLNQSCVQEFLQSIIFFDSKRAITKEVLMRLNWEEIYRKTSFNGVKESLPHVTHEQWLNYGNDILEIKPE